MQTVRRPTAYYQHLLDYERGYEAAGARVRGQLLLEGGGGGEGDAEGEGEGGDMRRMLEQHRQLQTKAGEQDISPDAETNTVMSSFEASQIPLLPEDSSSSNGDSAITGSGGESVLPAGVYDINHQQVDVRTRNSW